MFVSYARGQYTYMRALVRQKYYVPTTAKQKDLEKAWDRMNDIYREKQPVTGRNPLYYMCSLALVGGTTVVARRSHRMAMQQTPTTDPTKQQISKPI